jgi:hypothetical protein
MGLFSRSKKKRAAYLTQERAEVGYETSEAKAEVTEGVIGMINTSPDTRESGGLDDTESRLEWRADADPESDGARYEAIRAERHRLERGD